MNNFFLFKIFLFICKPKFNSPNMKKKESQSDYNQRSKLFYFISFTISFLSPILFIISLFTIFLSYQTYFSKCMLKICLSSTILFDSLITLKHLSSSQKGKIKNLYYDIFFHHLVNDLCIIITGSSSRLFLISKLPNYLYRFAIFLDYFVSRKSKLSGLSDIFLDISRPILKSVKLQLFRAITEILILPYLFGITFFSLCPKKLIALLVDFFFFILFAYRVDPFHRTIFQTFIDKIEREAYSRTDNMKNLVYSNLFLCEKIEFVGKLLYPIPYVY